MAHFYDKVNWSLLSDVKNILPLFKFWAKPSLFLLIFVLFTNLTFIDKSIDGVLGTRTRGGRMEGADESTELWRHPRIAIICRAISQNK